MQESGLTEIIPLLCISAIWGQDPVLSHPETPQGVTHRGVAAAAAARWCASCFPRGGCNVMPWWLQHPLLTAKARRCFSFPISTQLDSWGIDITGVCLWCASWHPVGVQETWALLSLPSPWAPHELNDLIVTILGSSAFKSAFSNLYSMGLRMFDWPEAGVSITIFLCLTKRQSPKHFSSGATPSLCLNLKAIAAHIPKCYIPS